MRSFLKKLAIITSLIGFVWLSAIWLLALPPYLLPNPLSVLHVFLTQGPLLLHHTVVSLKVICFGLGIGIILGIFFGILPVFLKRTGGVLDSFLIMGQALPSFVLLPIFVAWMGYGMLPRVIIVMLSTFFLVCLPFKEALMRLPLAFEDLLNQTPSPTLGTPLRKFLYVRFPFALPQLFSGIRLAATSAPMIVTACDWIGASQGLGYLMMWASGRMELDLVFACLAILIFLSLLLSKLTSLLSHFIIFWKNG